MEPRIAEDVPRRSPDLYAEYARLGVATVYEANHRRGLMGTDIRPMSPGQTICGPAVTVLNHPGDNLMVHAALAVMRPGDVLVMASTSVSEVALIGENLGLCALRQGAAGVVVEGAVRDARELRALGLPVWTRSISASGAVKATPGWVNAPIVCGGARVEPGDVVVGDDDGVVVVGLEECESVLEAARARADYEEENMPRYQSGELSVDILELRGVFASKGITLPGPT